MLFSRKFFHSINRLGKLVLSSHKRSHSTFKTQLNSSPVLVSTSRDVFSNLAIEHWLYSKLVFNNKTIEYKNDRLNNDIFKNPIVFIWVDEPSVVIGRHQNPWIESNFSFLNKCGIKLARRHSGGGCVYHDENNINISIIGGKGLFEKRQENLKFISRLLKKNYGIDCEPTPRHDIVQSGTELKISGSASKLGRNNCYHHFTVLVDTNEEYLQKAIRQNTQDFVFSNSTKSKRSKVINLKKICPNLTTSQVINDLVTAYNEHYGNPNVKIDGKNTINEGSSLPEMEKFKSDLISWNWIYGMTPKFKLERNLKYIDNGQEQQVLFKIHVNKGFFEQICIECNEKKMDGDCFQYLIGTRFTLKDAISNLGHFFQVDEKNLRGPSNVIENKKLLFATFLFQMIYDLNI